MIRAASALLPVIALLASCSSGSASPATPSPPPSSAGRFDVTLPGAGVTLGGILHRPEIPSGTSRPALVVLHGWQTAGTNGASLVEPRARRYSEDGYVALALSMRGWPPSGGADDCGLLQPDDVAEALRWLAALPGVDPARLGIVGFSQGGQVGLLAGARSAAAKAIVAYYPVTDVDRWKVTTTNADIPGYIQAVCEPGGTARRSPLANAATLVNPAVLLVHGELDTRVPTEQSLLMHDSLAALGRRTSLLLVPGAQHGFTAAEEAVARPVVDEFLARWLK